jgi:eukaryotic-like serine/threonine-protein kinase
MKAPARGLGLSWKIFLATAALVATILAITLYATSVSAKRAADVAVNRGLDQTRDIVDQQLRGREQGLAGKAKVFTEQPTFRGNIRQATSAGDRATVLDQTQEAVQQIGADWVQIVDAQGMLLARSDEPTAPARSLSNSPLIANALEGDDSQAFGAGDSSLFQAVVTPIAERDRDGSVLRIDGALMAVRFIDDSLALAINRNTESEIIFYALDSANSPRVVAASPGVGTGSGVQQFVRDQLRQSAPAETDTGLTPRAEAEFDGVHYLGQGMTLRSAGGAAVGGFFALRNRDSELAAFNRLRNAIILSGAAGLLLAFLLSYVIARQITRPVKSLVAATRKAADGDYSTEIRASSGDEIGELAAAFGTMLEDLREKQGLVEFMMSAGAGGGSGVTAPMPVAMSVTSQQRMAGEGVLIEPGRTLANRYEIKDILGVGGMGMVYKAVDRELGETIAIKTLKSDFMAQDPTALERFRGEIRLARKISHRNVVRTHDIGESGGVYYITMEFVEGKSLKDLIRSRGRLPVSVVLTVGKQLARALEVAHEQGVIHRDIKPQNIVVEPDGVLKVMDFGIARLAQRKEGVTQAGMIIGTPEYMAPEQLLGDELDGRSDLYAAGVVLYECLTGRTPFVADSPITLISKVLEEDPTPPHAINSDVPKSLSDVVLRTMSRDREARPKNAAELHDLLAQVEQTTDKKTPAVTLVTVKA